MYCTKKLTHDLYYVGGSDRRLALFENVFPIPRGVSYNSYLMLDDKTVLLDTVDKSISSLFFENLAQVLGGRTLDYVIVNHMEPDHAATLAEVVLRYPEATIVGNAKTFVMMKQFFDFDAAFDARIHVVKEGDTLSTGRHTLTFVMAPMVHWPEAMVTYDATDKILFSADAFGTFGALGGNLFADELNFERDWLPDARRYYANIVGKYGAQVQALLKKAAGLDIAMLCPLHGPIWRKKLDWFMEKYQRWSTYTPEETAVMIAYASVYGGTENAVNILAGRLAEAGVKNIAVYDVSNTHPSVIVAEAFRCSHLVFASTTYNAGVFCNMETVLLDLKAHNLQNRTVGLIQNGTWAPTAGSLMTAIFSGMKDITVLENMVSIKSAVKPQQLGELYALSNAMLDSMGLAAEPVTAEPVAAAVNPSAMFKLSYGLFVLTAREPGKDNGCIINTVTQITDNPKRISIAVNKQNYTCEMIKKTGTFNVSILSEDAPFKVFEHFGFQSGRNVNKFADCKEEARAQNGVLYIPKYTNAFLSGKVVDSYDYGTHTVFIAEVTEARILSDQPSVTYAYYFANIKPKPKAAETPKKGFICKICGYIYEGDTLPPDFICPLCKHGAEDFEPLK